MAIRSVEPPADEASSASPVLVAQKAVLYEEPVNATGDSSTAAVSAINASVTWRYVENGAYGPVIEANLTVPARGLKVKLTIHKNADSSLPASHLIDIQIEAPSDIPGKVIKKVPRFVMKPTEGARGQPLNGAEARITDGFFWIALSAADADVSANLALMRERAGLTFPSFMRMASAPFSPSRRVRPACSRRSSRWGCSRAYPAVQAAIAFWKTRSPRRRAGPRVAVVTTGL